MQSDSVLALAGGEARASELISAQPRAAYNEDEQRLSVYVQEEIEHLILGRRDGLVLVKMYPQQGANRAAVSDGRGAHVGAVRREVAEGIAADALGFFGPLHGGVVAQERRDDLILQRRRYSTAYPHINLERYDFYDAPTGEPLLGAWCAWRLQNLRRETQTNRVIDLALLALEVGKSVFPLLLP
jgi:hypothetical protein